MTDGIRCDKVSIMESHGSPTNLGGHCQGPLRLPFRQAAADGPLFLPALQFTAFAKQYALEHGPIILEMDTYR
jgi:hypothetical protein